MLRTMVLMLLVCHTLMQSAMAEEVSRATYDQWMEEISNWGRWGAVDELGTLNLLTPAVRKAAVAEVQTGETISLALELNKQKDPVNANPLEHTLATSAFGGHQVAGDRYAIDYHGFAHSHMDGLPHFAWRGKMYNGVPFDSVKPEGAAKLGIQVPGRKGVVARGVLVDIPRLKGLPWLEPGTAITVADLEAWEKANGVTVRAGDVLLVRTGRWPAVKALGQWNFVEKAAGMHASVAKWLKARDVAAIGCDGVSDVMPSGVEGLVNPLHELVLVGLGLPIFDNLDLEAVADHAAASHRTTFLFVAAPMRIPGGTGSPLNPLAIF
jgi:kynurenine formamidase